MADKYQTIMEWHGDKFIEAIDRMVYDALWQIGGDLQTASVNQCPLGVNYGNHKAGTLRRSCAYRIDKDGTQMTLTVGYGADVPYAWRQHQEQFWQHPRGGKWKYLEDPFNENMPRYKKHLQDTVKRWAKGEKK